MGQFPFPDRIQSREELKRDVLYRKIPKERRIPLCNTAWERGVLASKEMMGKYQEQDIRAMMKGEGLKLVFVPRDEVRGGLRTFGEYYTAKKEIVLYTGSISKWAKANHLNKKTAEDLILAHEFFHYLECVKIGEVSKLYLVPIIQIGKLSLGKSGIRALSEIAAHGFSRTYFETRGMVEAPEWEKTED